MLSNKRMKWKNQIGKVDIQSGFIFHLILCSRKESIFPVSRTKNSSLQTFYKRKYQKIEDVSTLDGFTLLHL